MSNKISTVLCRSPFHRKELIAKWTPQELQDQLLDCSTLILITTRKEKKRKDYAFRRQFNEKPSIIPGCPVQLENRRAEITHSGHPMAFVELLGVQKHCLG